jgi:hypothetical protein
MLVAKRDPPFDGAVHEHLSAHSARRSGRMLHGLQLIGSFLAIPVGLASAYSIYHTNFTIEARCETLRSNIVSMLDKNADPAALRMLVRRDVAAFENGCASVDPDAVAAFRKLLTGGAIASPSPKAALQAVAQPQPAPESIRQQAAKPVPEKKPAKAEAKPAQAETAKPQRRETEARPVRRDIETKPVVRDAVREQPDSDAAWLEAVRSALVHAPAAPAADNESDTRQPAPPPKPLGQLRAPAAAAAAAAPAAPAPAPAAAAPMLAPAMSVVAKPAPATEINHPVPPASIPDSAPQMTASVPAERPDKPERSRIKALIADIPLLGRMVDR